MAILASVIANSNPYRKGQPIKPKAFLPEFGTAREQTPGSLEQMAKMFVTAHNRAVPKKPKPKKKTR